MLASSIPLDNPISSSLQEAVIHSNLPAPTLLINWAQFHLDSRRRFLRPLGDGAVSLITIRCASIAMKRPDASPR